MTGFLYSLDISNSIVSEVVASGPEPGARYGHSCFYWGSQIFVYGGFDNNMDNLNDMYVYDVDANQWTNITTSVTGPLPYPYSAFSAYWNGGPLFYLFSGIYFATESAAPVIFTFDPTSSTWGIPEVNGNIPAGWGASVVVTGSNTAYLYGFASNNDASSINPNIFQVSFGISNNSSNSSTPSCPSATPFM